MKPPVFSDMELEAFLAENPIWSDEPTEVIADTFLFQAWLVGYRWRDLRDEIVGKLEDLRDSLFGRFFQ